MGAMNQLSLILEDMITTGNDLVAVATALREYFSGSPPEAEPEHTVPVRKERPPLTKEDVRKILVAKSNECGGAYRPLVKELVRKYSGGGNLSSVPPEDYEALVAELEAVSDG